MPFISARATFDFKPVGNGDIQLQGGLHYQDRKAGLIRVPSGFVCDLASYPRFVRALFDRLGHSMRAAVIHDWLYRHQPEGVTRAMADRIFRQALKEEGASWFEQWASWTGVRVGGWYSWRKHARKRQQGIPAS